MTERRMTTEDYDQESVRYCPRCYSLRIGCIEGIDNSDYCMECGCSETAETDIVTWEKLYRQRYKRDYVPRGCDPRRRRVYRMSDRELKQALYDRDDWKRIVKALYRDFPENLTRAESAILAMDMLEKDRRVDELRDLLISK